MFFFRETKMNLVAWNKTTKKRSSVFWMNILGNGGVSSASVMKSLPGPRRSNAVLAVTNVSSHPRDSGSSCTLRFSCCSAALLAWAYHLPERTPVCTHNSALQYSDLGNTAQVQAARRQTCPLGRRGIYGKRLKTRHFLDNCWFSQVFI